MAETKVMKLGKPPVVEAWVEFRFRVAPEAAPWDESEVARFLTSAYSDVFKTRDYLGRWNFTVQQEAGHPRLKENHWLMERGRASNEDGSRFVQAGRDVLIYNMLRLDRTWPEYPELRGGALEAYEKYQAHTEPQGLASIGLHYRDVVTIPAEAGKAVDLEEYFLIRPNCPSEIFGNIGRLRVSLVFPAASEAGLLRFEMSDETVPPEPAGAVIARFRLDWHLATDWRGSLEIGAIGDWLDRAHTDVTRMFRACFTEKCWELFEPEGA